MLAILTKILGEKKIKVQKFDGNSTIFMELSLGRQMQLPCPSARLYFNSKLNIY